MQQKIAWQFCTVQGDRNSAIFLSSSYELSMVKISPRTQKRPASRAPSNPFLSIQKAFRILELLAAHSPRGVTEIAAELGLEKSSVSRLLKALSELGYAVQSAQRGQYQVSPRILALAQHYLEDDERRYGVEHQGEGVPYEYTYAYLLGADGRRFLDKPLRNAVTGVLDRFSDPDEPLSAYADGDHLTGDARIRYTEQFAAKHARLKSLLMDQKFIAGIGNVYSDEILFQAGLKWDRMSDSLSEQEIRRLYRAIFETLQEAVKHRGTTVDDYPFVDLYGKPGDYQGELKVYGREGEPCRRCRAPIAKARFANKPLYFCEACQV